MSNKLVTTYIQFLTKIKKIYVGQKLLQQIKLNKINYLFILPECSLKNKNRLLSNINKKVEWIDIKENQIDLNKIGFEKLNAFGTSHELGKRIKEELIKEVNDV